MDKNAKGKAPKDHGNIKKWKDGAYLGICEWNIHNHTNLLEKLDSTQVHKANGSVLCVTVHL